ncbi:hypothetical protein ACFSQ7_47220 [Paenibacillus rhizoplanae]
MQDITTPLFTIPKLTTPRVEEISSLFGGRLWQAAADNLSAFSKLMWSGSDGLAWNSISPYGYAYPMALPFCAARPDRSPAFLVDKPAGEGECW